MMSIDGCCIRHWGYSDEETDAIPALTEPKPYSKESDVWGEGEQNIEFKRIQSSTSTSVRVRLPSGNADLLGGPVREDWFRMSRFRREC